MVGFFVIVGIILVIVISSNHENKARLEVFIERSNALSEENQKLKQGNNELIKKNNTLLNENENLRNNLKNSIHNLEADFNIRLNRLENEKQFYRKMLVEAPLGFPSLLEALKLYEMKEDERTAHSLEMKSHPAYTAAETVREETRKRREAEYESRQSKLLLNYYFSVFPDLQDEREISLEKIDDIEKVPVDENEDIVGRYLSRQEYQGLSTTERNQLALDRFWKKHKSSLLIGRLYEQYVGFLYEKDGWEVEYYGISEGKLDKGRDLICHKDGKTLIVQCKNWSKAKTIYEKHLFQLFGTTFEYMTEHPLENVRGVFYTSTLLSDFARYFSQKNNIELHENFELKQFPIIKCNIGRNGEKIYHLPFDQQYYNTKITPKDGEFYCETVAEAESRGFRRAYRWRGNN